jgi:hypothetical protein
MSMKQVRVVDDKVSIHSDTDITAPIVAELQPGDTLGIEIGKNVKVSGVSWCAATLPDGKVGYVVGTIKVFRIRPVTLAQSFVAVFESPSDRSEVKATYSSGDKFILAGVAKEGRKKWLEIRTDSGDVGFVPVGTQTKDIADPHRPEEDTNHSLLRKDHTGNGEPLGVEDSPTAAPPKSWWTSKWAEPITDIFVVILTTWNRATLSANRWC